MQPVVDEDKVQITFGNRCPELSETIIIQLSNNEASHSPIIQYMQVTESCEVNEQCTVLYENNFHKIGKPNACILYS